jgi:hypothetical protein
MTKRAPNMGTRVVEPLVIEVFDIELRIQRTGHLTAS